MQSVTCDELRRTAIDLVRRVHDDGQRIIVTRDGKPVAAIVSIEDLELLVAIEERHDRAEIDAALREAETDGFYAWDDVKAELSRKR
jgi:prevent-host-death family protein